MTNENQHPVLPVKKKKSPTPQPLLDSMNTKIDNWPFFDNLSESKIVKSNTWPFPIVNGERIEQVIAPVVVKQKPTPIDLQPPF